MNPKYIRREIEVPVWANWMARNDIGDWYVYDYPPVWTDDDGWIAPDGREEKLYTGKVRGHARNSLQRI